MRIDGRRERWSLAADPQAGLYRAGCVLTLGTAYREALGGLASGAPALLACATHTLLATLSMLRARRVTRLATLSPPDRAPDDARQVAILAAALLLPTGIVLWQGLLGLGDAQPPALGTVAMVASTAALASGGGAWMIAAGCGRTGPWGAVVGQLATSAGLSLAVLGGACLVSAHGPAFLLPAIGLGACGLTIAGCCVRAREGLALAGDPAVAAVDRHAIAVWLAARPGVHAVIDLRVTALDPYRVAVAAHLVVPSGTSDIFLEVTAEGLRRRFGIHHVTLEIRTELDVAGVADVPEPGVG